MMAQIPAMHLKAHAKVELSQIFSRQLISVTQVKSTVDDDDEVLDSELSLLLSPEVGVLVLESLLLDLHPGSSGFITGLQ